jgi:uncharacterized protein YjbI with pentapeptide repeats
VDFSWARLDNANLFGSAFTACYFTGVSAQNSIWRHCQIVSYAPDDDFSSCVLDDADFTDALIVNALSKDGPIPPHFSGAILAWHNDNDVRRRVWSEDGEQSEPIREAHGDAKMKANETIGEK